MKVLIVDDERTARKILEAFLSKEKYEVVVAEDGPGALKSALTLVEPYIAILDWTMPGMSGLQVCAALRSSKGRVRPYVIMLSARADKSDIALALDSGVDDYLSKPFNHGELLARLRVAVRTLQYQTDLQQQIGQLEILVQRYNLLGEIFAQQGESRGSAGPVGAGRPGSGETKRPLEAGEADAIMQRVLADLGFASAQTVATKPGDAYRPLEYTAWAGLILEREQIWLDLLLGANATTMALIFEKALGRPPGSDREKQEFLAETHTIISAAFKVALQDNGFPNFAPILTRVRRTQGSQPPVPAKRETHHFTLQAGVTIGLTLVWRECRLQKMSPNWLRVSDIMAGAYPPTDGNELPLLSKGTVLTERFIEKLVRLSEEEPEGEKMIVPVFSASPLAVYFGGEASESPR
jgi:CheY-like chemotaxis protein